MRTVLSAALCAALALAFPATTLAETTAGQPFPSNLLTTPDDTQATGLRVDLPMPDCGARPSDCADVAVRRRSPADGDRSDAARERSSARRGRRSRRASARSSASR